jgi:hypothetical protein
MNMQWFRRLTRPKQPVTTYAPEPSDIRERLHRLEIAFNEQRERLDGLEGRHASLSASVRGRLGGRGNKAPSVPLTFPMGLQG